MLKDRIRQQYRVRLILDNLPITTFDLESELELGGCREGGRVAGGVRPCGAAVQAPGGWLRQRRDRLGHSAGQLLWGGLAVGPWTSSLLRSSALSSSALLAPASSCLPSSIGTSPPRLTSPAVMAPRTPAPSTLPCPHHHHHFPTPCSAARLRGGLPRGGQVLCQQPPHVQGSGTRNQRPVHDEPADRGGGGGRRRRGGAF